MSSVVCNDYEIETWVKEALSVFNLEEDLEILVEWNNRFKSRMGDALYLRSGVGRIRLSTFLWPRATHEQRRITVIHEVCHLICRHLYGPGKEKTISESSLVRLETTF